MYDTGERFYFDRRDVSERSEWYIKLHYWLQTGIREVLLAVNWKTGAVKSVMYHYNEDST